MSMIVLVAILVTVECAPKLGNILFDPLIYEVTELDSSNKIIENTNVETGLNEKILNKTLEVIHNVTYEKETNLTKNETSNMNLKEQTISTSTLRINIDIDNFNITVANAIQDVTKPTAESKEITTDEQTRTPSQTQDNSHFSTSSEWLYPESESTEKYINNMHENNATKIRLLATRSIPSPKSKENSKTTSEIKPLSKDVLEQKHTREIIAPQNIIMKLLRNAAGPKDKKKLEYTENPGEGYDYDLTICRYYGDRYLCGYNKNTGVMKDYEEIEELGNGCRMRGDRMECGYINGPFTPKINDRNPRHLNTDWPQTQTDTMKNRQPQTKPDSTNKANAELDLAKTITPSEIPDTETKTACVEKDGRIVCYNIAAVVRTL